MSSFHFCLSAAKNLSLFQLLPASLMTDLLQLFLGLPLFLLPWEFHSRAAFDISASSFLNVWPIHLNFLFLISRFISSWSVTLHKSLLVIIFGHHIIRILRTRNYVMILNLSRDLRWNHCCAICGISHGACKIQDGDSYSYLGFLNVTSCWTWSRVFTEATFTFTFHLSCLVWRFNPLPANVEKMVSS